MADKLAWGLEASSSAARSVRVRVGCRAQSAGQLSSHCGRYRVLQQIGVGGMAAVHLAQVEGPGGFMKHVAIKRLHRHLAQDVAFVRMFLDEARVAAGISHPHVAHVFELGQQERGYWIAMEYLHGEPLRNAMCSHTQALGPPMGMRLAAKLIADAAEGLHAAHELRDHNGEPLGLVHRDVSPQNIFLTYGGLVKLVDFGIAKAARRLTNTRTGTLKGKLSYMSPEQAGGGPIDRRSDVFALGVVLWELTTGIRLFGGHCEMSTLGLVSSCRVPAPGSVVRGFPRELAAIVMHALQRDPSARFQTAREMSRALQGFLVRSGSLISYDELGAYLRRSLASRFHAREAWLRRASASAQSAAADRRLAYSFPCRHGGSPAQGLGRGWAAGQAAEAEADVAATTEIMRSAAPLRCPEADEAVTRIIERVAHRIDPPRRCSVRNVASAGAPLPRPASPGPRRRHPRRRQQRIRYQALKLIAAVATALVVVLASLI